MAGTIQDVLVRLTAFDESDPLDFKNKRRAVFVIEDGMANLPLPKGDKGDKGDAGPKGDPLKPDLIIDYPTDSEALAYLGTRTTGWDSSKTGYFVINKTTKSGFFWQNGGWAVIPSLFTSSAAGEFTIPTLFRNVASAPATPSTGVVVYAEGNSLKAKKSDGTVVTLA